MTTTEAPAGPVRPLSARGTRWEVGILLAWLGALALVRAGVLQESDPYWQVRAGMENLAGAPLARPDTWSWAPVEGLFTQTSPLWNDLLGLGYRTAGFAGFFGVALISVLSYFAVAVSLSRRLGARPLPTLVGVLVSVLPALAMLSPRASLAAQTLFMGGVLLADTWRRRAPRPTAVADVAVVALTAFAMAALGSWVHLSWLLLAPASALSWAVLWWTTPTATGIRRVLLTGASVAGAVGGVLVGPYGLSAWELSRRVQAACEGVVIEWAGMFTPELVARWAPAGVLAIAGFALALRWVLRSWGRRQSDGRVGLVLSLTLVGLPAALGALQAIRFVGVALLLLAPVAALAATEIADRLGERAAAQIPRGLFRSPRVRRWADAGPWRVVLTAVAALVVPAAVLAGSSLGQPTTVQAAAGALPRDCRLLSDPSSAGAVLLLRPDVRVWIDGRADYWGHARNAEAVTLLTGDTLDSPAVRGATCVVLASSVGLDSRALAAALDRSPDWSRLAVASAAAAWARAQ